MTERDPFAPCVERDSGNRALRGHVPTLHGLAEPRGSPVPAPAWPAVTLAREPRVLRGPALVTGDSPEEGRGTQWQQGGVHEGDISDDREGKK